MLGKTHAAIGAMTGAALLPILHVPRPDILWPAPFSSLLGPSSSARMTDVLITIIGIGCSALGALLPDIDESHSIVAREVAPVPILSRRITMLLMAVVLAGLAYTGRMPLQMAVIFASWLVMAALVKHRGLTHSLVGLAMAFFSVRALDSGIAIAFTAGYGSHLLADMVTDHGVVLFWPWHRRIRFPTGLRTGGLFELPIRIAAGVYSLGILVSAAGGAPIVHWMSSWI